MKKLFVAWVLPLVLMAHVAGAQSVSTIIEGVVPQMLTISTDMSAVTSIDVFNTSSTFLGFINIFSNRQGKWTITISSNNAGAMRGTAADNSDSYPYTLRLGETSNIDLSDPYVIEMYGQTNSDGLQYQLAIDFQNFWELPIPVSPDTYRDTITITIAAA
jgi:hypothetical protein